VEATLVACYLYPRAMEDLKPRFEAQRRSGSLVLSNTFAVPGWQPAAVFTADDLFSTQVYLYRVSAPDEPQR